MKPSLFTAAASLAALSITAAAFAGEPDRDRPDQDGDKITETYDFTGFDRIAISGVYELEVTVGEKFSVALSGYERDMARADVKFTNGVLHLDHKDRDRWGKRSEHHGVEARITLPDLKGVDVSGVVDGSVKGVKADAFQIKVSGVGDMDFSGTCKSLKAQISGVGDVDADELRCADVEVTVSGVGDASVFASRSVDAAVSGMGDIDVYGSPEKVSETSGMFSEVTIR